MLLLTRDLLDYYSFGVDATALHVRNRKTAVFIVFTQQNDLGDAVTLTARWPDPRGSFWELEIVFQGIRDLRITVTGPWDIQTPGFVIEDISAWQWEGIRLRVYDQEGAPVGFNAQSARVRWGRPAAARPVCPTFGRQEPDRGG